MSDNNDSELNDIKEGFKLFGSETNAIINPAEFKEIMELMNMNEKSPFLYNIVTKLCSNEEIQQKGGINAEEFISLLDQELDDTSTLEGLQNIFSIFSDNDNTKMSLPIISQLLNQEKDLGLEQDEEKIKKLFSRQEISGKKIDFDEFKDIMNTKNEKINKIFIKETSNNSNNKNSYSYENSQINNNNNLNNIKFHDSNINNKIKDENNLDNNINEINIEEINNNNNEELKSNDKINNFDSSNQENKLNKTKKRYRYMNKSSDNSQEKEEKEINNKEDEKIDKTEKRYHRRYREAKSPINKQKEENLNKDNKIEEQNSNNKKFSYSHWRFRGKK